MLLQLQMKKGKLPARWKSESFSKRLFRNTKMNNNTRNSIRIPLMNIKRREEIGEIGEIG